MPGSDTALHRVGVFTPAKAVAPSARMPASMPPETLLKLVAGWLAGAGGVLVLSVLIRWFG
jgi:hypothetical protein